jgi:hypothetical protein
MLRQRGQENLSLYAGKFSLKIVPQFNIKNKMDEDNDEDEYPELGALEDCPICGRENNPDEQDRSSNG